MGAVTVSARGTGCLLQHVGSAGAAAAAAAARREPQRGRPEEILLPPSQTLRAIEHEGAGSIGFLAHCHWLLADIV